MSNVSSTGSSARAGAAAPMNAGEPTAAGGSSVAAPPPNGAGRRKKIFIIGGGILLVLGLAVGVPWYIHSQKYMSTDDAFVQAHVVQIAPQIAAPVLAVRVLDNQFVKKGTVLVTLDPRNYLAQLYRIKAQLASARAAAVGKQFDLALVNKTSSAAYSQAQAQVVIAQASIAVGRAAIAQSQSTLAQARAMVLSAKADIARATAQVQAAQAQAVMAKDDFHRYATLLKTGDVTPVQLESYRAASITAQANVTAARKNVLAKVAALTQANAAVHAARQGVLAARAQLNQAAAGLQKSQAQLAAVNVVPEEIGRKTSSFQSQSAQVAELKAALRQAMLNLSYCVIKAPVSGYVTQKSVEPGDYVTAGQILLSIVRPNMWVIANFKETALTKMKPGDPVTISIDAYPNYTFDGYVQSIQAGTGASFSLLPPENATGNYVKVVQRVPVKILFKNLPKKMPYLASGMSAVPEVKVQ